MRSAPKSVPGGPAVTNDVSGTWAAVARGTPSSNTRTSFVTAPAGSPITTTTDSGAPASTAIERASK